MSFKTVTCPNCFASYEFYQRWHLVPDCPHCGTGINGAKPLTSDEYYKAMGVVKQSLTTARAS